jgi:hypothetical protein
MASNLMQQCHLAWREICRDFIETRTEAAGQPVEYQLWSEEWDAFPISREIVTNFFGFTVEPMTMPGERPVTLKLPEYVFENGTTTLARIFSIESPRPKQREVPMYPADMHKASIEPLEAETAKAARVHEDAVGLFVAALRTAKPLFDVFRDSLSQPAFHRGLVEIAKRFGKLSFDPVFVLPGATPDAQARAATARTRAAGYPGMTKQREDEFEPIRTAYAPTHVRPGNPATGTYTLGWQAMSAAMSDFWDEYERRAMVLLDVERILRSKSPIDEPIPISLIETAGKGYTLLSRVESVGPLATATKVLEDSAAAIGVAVKKHSELAAKLADANAIFVGAVKLYEDAVIENERAEAKERYIVQTAYDSMLAKLTEWFRRRAVDQRNSCENERKHKNVRVHSAMGSIVSVPKTKRLRLDLDDMVKNMQRTRTIRDDIQKIRSLYENAVRRWREDSRAIDTDVILDVADECLRVLYKLRIASITLVVVVTDIDQLVVDIERDISVIQRFIAVRTWTLMLIQDVSINMQFIEEYPDMISKENFPRQLSAKLEQIVLTAVETYVTNATVLQSQVFVPTDPEKPSPLESIFFRHTRLVNPIVLQQLRNSRVRIINANKYVTNGIAGDDAAHVDLLLVALESLRNRSLAWRNARAVSQDIWDQVDALVRLIDTDLTDITTMFADVNAFGRKTREELIAEAKPPATTYLDQARELLSSRIALFVLPADWRDPDRTDFWKNLTIWKKQALANYEVDRERIAQQELAEKAATVAARLAAAREIEEANREHILSQRAEKIRHDRVQRQAEEARMLAMSKMKNEELARLKQQEQDARRLEIDNAGVLEQMSLALRLRIEKRSLEMETVLLAPGSVDSIAFADIELLVHQYLYVLARFLSAEAAFRGNSSVIISPQTWLPNVIQALFSAFADCTMPDAWQEYWIINISRHVETIMPNVVPGLNGGLALFQEYKGMPPKERATVRRILHDKKSPAKSDDRFDVSGILDGIVLYKDENLVDGAESFVTMLSQAAVALPSDWKERLKGKTFDDAYSALQAMINERRSWS